MKNEEGKSETASVIMMSGDECQSIIIYYEREKRYPDQDHKQGIFLAFDQDGNIPGWLMMESIHHSNLRQVPDERCLILSNYPLPTKQ